MFRGIGMPLFFASNSACFFVAVRGSLSCVRCGSSARCLRRASVWVIIRLRVSATSVAQVLQNGWPPISMYAFSMSTFCSHVNDTFVSLWKIGIIPLNSSIHVSIYIYYFSIQVSIITADRVHRVMKYSASNGVKINKL